MEGLWDYRLVVRFEGLAGDVLQAEAARLPQRLGRRARVDGGGVQGRRSFLSISTDFPREIWDDVHAALPEEFLACLRSAEYQSVAGRPWIALWPEPDSGLWRRPDQEQEAAGRR